MIRALARKKSQVSKPQNNEAAEEDVAIIHGRNKCFAEVKRLLDIKHKQYHDDKESLIKKIYSFKYWVHSPIANYSFIDIDT